LKLPAIIANPDKQILSLQIQQLLRTGATFIVSIFLAKFFDKSIIISQYEYLILIGSSFTFFWVTGFITAFLPVYHSSSSESQNSVIFSSFLSLAAASIVVFSAILLISYFVIESLDQQLILYYAIFILFNSPSFLTDYLFIIKSKNKALIFYAVIIFIIQILIICLPLYLGHGLLVSVKLLAVFGFLKFCLTFILVYSNSKFAYNTDVFRAYLSKSSPIIISFLVGGSAEFIDGFIVKYFKPDDFVLFRYGARELPLVLLLANSLSNISSGEFAKAYQKGDVSTVLSNLKKSTLRLQHLLFPFTIILMAGSSFLFREIYNDSFVAAHKIFNVYLLLFSSRLIIPQAIILGLQKNKLFLRATFIIVLLNISLSILFISLIGVIGVAYATLLSHYLYKLYMILTCNFMRKKIYLNHIKNSLREQ